VIKLKQLEDMAINDAFPLAAAERRASRSALFSVSRLKLWHLHYIQQPWFPTREHWFSVQTTF